MSNGKYFDDDDDDIADPSTVSTKLQIPDRVQFKSQTCVTNYLGQRIYSTYSDRKTLTDMNINHKPVV
jgi:hypothetical protein